MTCDNKGWKSDVIETLGNTSIDGLFARSGNHAVAAYQEGDNPALRVAKSGTPWTVQTFDMAVFDENDKPDFLCASSDGTATLLFAGDQGLAMLADFKMPSLTLIEEIPIQKVFAMAMDAEDRPVVVFLDFQGTLRVATRKQPPQLAAAPPENGVLRFPSGAMTEVSTETTILPSQTRPGS
jgi:hypothetical protein